MRIRMLTDMADASAHWQSGEIYDMDNADAKRLIKAGMAEPATKLPPTASVVENAMLPDDWEKRSLNDGAT